MIEQTLDIATKNGAMETFIVHPDHGAHPPVLLLMDAPGIREELRDMARRLGTVGYYVMLPNLYYRAGRDTIYGPDVLTKGSEEQARMRAVENARWLLRTTNTGVTAAIDPAGRIAQSAPRKVRTVLQASYALNDATTFYTRHGDWLGYLCAIISVGAITVALTRAKGRRIA